MHQTPPLLSAPFSYHQLLRQVPFSVLPCPPLKLTLLRLPVTSMLPNAVSLLSLYVIWPLGNTWLCSSSLLGLFPWLTWNHMVIPSQSTELLNLCPAVTCGLSRGSWDTPFPHLSSFQVTSTNHRLTSNIIYMPVALNLNIQPWWILGGVHGY